jgi:hypothetical protein
MGDDPSKAASAAQTVLALETTLAQASMTRVEQRDPQKLYHRMTIEQMSDLGKNFDWPAFFKGIGLKQKADVNVGTPEFFKMLDQQLVAVPIADWQTYLRWHLINNTASSLSAPFVDEDFNFKSRILQGARENLPRWKRCVAATNTALGEAVGEIYVKKIPSMRVTDLARAVSPEAAHEIVGIRPGEKLHEQMIGSEDALYTYEYQEHFKILPAIHNWSADPIRIKDGKKVSEGFVYASDTNADWMDVGVLRAWIDQNRARIGQF